MNALVKQEDMVAERLADKHHYIDVEQPKVKKNEPPKFKARFWYRSDRLDARPVIWSLKNRPEEWVVTQKPIRQVGSSPTDGVLLLHIPSQHTFDGIGLFAAECPCREHRFFQPFQTNAYRKARRQWFTNKVQERIQEARDHFASHFLPQEL